MVVDKSMDFKGFDKNIAIDQEEVLRPKMVTVEIAGKKYEVPEGITVIKALWYSGQEVIRGAGCLGGFCGACATYYRTKDDPKVRTRSEEHTSELQSLAYLVCRLLLEKKKK